VVAAHFIGAPNARGMLTQTLKLPPLPYEGTLWFAYRIENQDYGWGATPQAPYDDWLTVELRDAGGRTVSSLLRTGNSADTASDGLLWDRYLYRLQPADLRQLSTSTPLSLVFLAGNDGDSQLTDFWVDEVRFCASPGHRLLVPQFFSGRFLEH
jgi:hypothetical protein